MFIEPGRLALEMFCIFGLRHIFLRDRTVFLVGVDKHSSRLQDRESPLLIEVQAQLNSKDRKLIYATTLERKALTSLTGQSTPTKGLKNLDHEQKLHLDGTPKSGFQKTLDCHCDLRHLRGRSR